MKINFILLRSDLLPDSEDREIFPAWYRPSPHITCNKNFLWEKQFNFWKSDQQNLDINITGTFLWRLIKRFNKIDAIPKIMWLLANRMGIISNGKIQNLFHSIQHYIQAVIRIKAKRLITNSMFTLSVSITSLQQNGRKYFNKLLSASARLGCSIIHYTAWMKMQ